MAFEGLRRASIEFDRRLVQAHVRRCEREREVLSSLMLSGDGNGNGTGCGGGGGGDGGSGGDGGVASGRCDRVGNGDDGNVCDGYMMAGAVISTDPGLELECLAATQGDGAADLASERHFDRLAFPPFRPGFAAQLGRSVLHTLQLVTGYFMMMYVFPFLFLSSSRTTVVTDRPDASICRMATYYNGYIILCIFAGAFTGHFVFHWDWVGSLAGESRRKNDREAADRRREDETNKQRTWAEKMRRGFRSQSPSKMRVRRRERGRAGGGGGSRDASRSRQRLD